MNLAGNSCLSPDEGLEGVVKPCAMPVNASNLAWLLQHPRLKEVSIRATEVTYRLLAST